MDTDTLIAIVKSLLNANADIHNDQDILDAIVLHNGDTEAAARHVHRPKRFRPNAPAHRLDNWLSSSKPRPPSKPTATAAPLLSVLKPPPSLPKKAPRLPPLTLSTPALVAQHTPCTLHPSILPPELAARLFTVMSTAAQSWSRNKWFLFDRVVESPHRTSFFARRTDGVDDDESWQEAAQFWYNGRKTDPPLPFPPEMEQACIIIEHTVNAELEKRNINKSRLPLEWAGSAGWRANVAAANCYEGGKESVGWHSDQLTYLGPYPTIASLSLGTRRTFSLRETVPADEADSRAAQTFNIPLSHNSLTIMHASCQERFKHCIPPQSTIDLYHTSSDALSSTSTLSSIPEPSNKRINITFRFYRPDFRPPSIPRCKCGVPTVLRPDQKKKQQMQQQFLKPRSSSSNAGTLKRSREREHAEKNNFQKRDKVRYWWACYAGAQNEGKGCGMWRVMDMKAEGRGPCIGDNLSSAPGIVIP